MCAIIYYTYILVHKHWNEKLLMNHQKCLRIIITFESLRRNEPTFNVIIIISLFRGACQVWLAFKNQINSLPRKYKIIAAIRSPAIKIIVLKRSRVCISDSNLV